MTRFLKELAERRIQYPETLISKLIISIFFGVMVGGFLFYYTPFNINNIPVDLKMEISLIFSFLTTLSTFLVLFVFPLIEKVKFNNNNYNNKFLTWQLLSVVALLLVLKLFFFEILDLNSLYSISVVQIIWMLSDIYIFPAYALANLINWSEHAVEPIYYGGLTFKRNDKQKSIVEIKDESSKTIIQFDLDSFIQAVSSQNYIELYLLDENMLVKKNLIRMTFHQFEDQMSSFQSIVKCHRSHIVNLECVTNIEKNKGKFWLKLAHLVEMVPVSENFPLNDYFSELK